MLNATVGGRRLVVSSLPGAGYASCRPPTADGRLRLAAGLARGAAREHRGLEARRALRAGGLLGGLLLGGFLLLRHIILLFAGRPCAAGLWCDSLGCDRSGPRRGGGNRKAVGEDPPTAVYRAGERSYPGDTSAEGVTLFVPETREARGRASSIMSRRLTIVGSAPVRAIVTLRVPRRRARVNRWVLGLSADLWPRRRETKYNGVALPASDDRGV